MVSSDVNTFFRPWAFFDPTGGQVNIEGLAYVQPDGSEFRCQVDYIDVYNL